MTADDAPLAGVRVVDLTTSYAGPVAAMYLGDLGADVVKVERVEGDDARGWGPPFVDGTSAWFLSANRNKRGVALDITRPQGRAVLDRLLSSADVFVENLNPGKLARLGLDPAQTRRRHPRLIYCALSGFGLTGPDAGLPGYDLVAQARSGLMSVTGEEGGMPQRVSTALSDIVCGLVAALAVTAALRRQEQTGAGELVDVSLLDADLALMAPRIASFLAGEPEPRPSGGKDSVIAVYQPVPTADRPIVVAAGSDAIWRRLCAVLDLPDLADDPRLTSNAGRRAHRDHVLARIEARLRTAPAEYWLKRLGEAGVPAASVQTLSGVTADPQVRARGAITELEYGDLPVRAVRSPWLLDSQQTRPDRPPPRLGWDTRSVLAELGFGEEEVESLIASGVAAAPDEQENIP
ncbi:MAG: CoA transferase [Streptosporangiales bacterium]|nr:CoA transferase [Streptosporangiales bacterium]